MRERKDFWLEKLGQRDVYPERRRTLYLSSVLGGFGRWYLPVTLGPDKR